MVDIIKVPKQDFELGDPMTGFVRYSPGRPIYGPPNENNMRPIIGFVIEDWASKLEDQLEK